MIKNMGYWSIPHSMMFNAPEEYATLNKYKNTKGIFHSACPCAASIYARQLGHRVDCTKQLRLFGPLDCDFDREI
jgi:hypothetical protein